MARRRKSGQRTKSGRLSRAYTDPRVRDHGTAEAQAKRKALVGADDPDREVLQKRHGNHIGDPNLSESAPGILFAHGYLDKEQYAQAVEYRRLRCAIYGTPWPVTSTGPDASEASLVKLHERFDAKVRHLTEEQKLVVTNVAVMNAIPNWFFCDKLGLKWLPEDYAERDALITGLNAMLGRAERKAA